MKRFTIVLLLAALIIRLLGSIQFTPDFLDYVPVLKGAAPVTVTAGGDVMLGRFVETMMKREGQDYPFKRIAQLFKNSDIGLVNLEGPIVENHVQTPDFTTVFSFDRSVASVLKRNGINLVNLANNHTYDKGEKGYSDTRKFLSSAGIDFFGHSTKVNSDFGVVVKEGIVFVGFHDTFLVDFDADKAVQLISQLRDDYPDNFILANFHWGVEYRRSSTNRQRLTAYKIIDAGADMIVGHHPHVVEEHEQYNGKHIYYSLGNLVFDQFFSQYTQEGLVLRLTIDGREVSVEEIPVKLIKTQPRIVDRKS